MKIREPAEVIVEFLHTQIPEPIRSYQDNNYAQRLTSISETLTGDGSTKIFTVTNTPLVSITSITVGGTSQNKYDNYDIDLKRNQIIFGTAPGNSVSIVITYKYGSAWIFPDKPRADLSTNSTTCSYPRISCVQINNPSEVRGNSTQFWHEGIAVQVDMISRKGVELAIDSTDYVIIEKNNGVTGKDFQLSE